MVTTVPFIALSQMSGSSFEILMPRYLSQHQMYHEPNLGCTKAESFLTSRFHVMPHFASIMSNLLYVLLKNQQTKNPQLYLESWKCLRIFGCNKLLSNSASNMTQNKRLALEEMAEMVRNKLISRESPLDDTHRKWKRWKNYDGKWCWNPSFCQDRDLAIFWLRRRT